MQGAYSKSKKYQLPRPYGLKPKDNKLPRVYFTTPMKKMLGYMVLLFLIGTFLYLFGPKKDHSDDDDVTISVDNSDSDTFINTAASSKKNSKLTVDQVIGDGTEAAVGAVAGSVPGSDNVAKKAGEIAGAAAKNAKDAAADLLGAQPDI